MSLIVSMGSQFKSLQLLSQKELRQPFECTALNYLEIFAIDSAAIQRVADDYPSARSFIRKRTCWLCLRRTIVHLAKAKLGLRSDEYLAEKSRQEMGSKFFSGLTHHRQSPPRSPVEQSTRSRLPPLLPARFKRPSSAGRRVRTPTPLPDPPVPLTPDTDLS